MSRDSKFLSRALRHVPEEIDLSLDQQGWVLVDELLRKLKRAGHTIGRDRLMSIIGDDDKQRFTLSTDGRRIRAAQGHSLPIDLGLAPAEPPEFLFHGTASANLDHIFSEGINSGNRHHVHLSTNSSTAKAVGRRHGRAIVLKI